MIGVSVRDCPTRAQVPADGDRIGALTEGSRSPVPRAGPGPVGSGWVEPGESRRPPSGRHRTSPRPCGGNAVSGHSMARRGPSVDLDAGTHPHPLDVRSPARTASDVCVAGPGVGGVVTFDPVRPVGAGIGPDVGTSVGDTADWTRASGGVDPSGRGDPGPVVLPFRSGGRPFGASNLVGGPPGESPPDAVAGYERVSYDDMSHVSAPPPSGARSGVLAWVRQPCGPVGVDGVAGSPPHRRVSSRAWLGAEQCGAVRCGRWGVSH